MLDGNKFATIVEKQGSRECGGGMTYRLDGNRGSSGSPVIGYSDHFVVGINKCGGCDEHLDYNTGVPVERILEHLEDHLPASAIGIPESAASTVDDITDTIGDGLFG